MKTLSVNSKEELAQLKERFKRLREAKDVVNDSRVSLGIDQESGLEADVVAQQKLQKAITLPIANKLDDLKAAQQALVPGSVAVKQEGDIAGEPAAVKDEVQSKLQALQRDYAAGTQELENIWKTRNERSLDSVDEEAGAVAVILIEPAGGRGRRAGGIH